MTNLSRLRSAAFAIAIALFMTSCGEQKVQMSRAVKRTIDTAAAKKLVILRPALDSLCEAQYDSLFSVAVDSIIEVRELEINRIIRKDEAF